MMRVARMSLMFMLVLLTVCSIAAASNYPVLVQAVKEADTTTFRSLLQQQQVDVQCVRDRRVDRASVSSTAGQH